MTPTRRLSTTRDSHAGGTVEFVQGNAYATGLPGGDFDLVHTRFVGSTAGEPEALIREAMRLARPGGIVAMQEPDMATLVCNPPHPAWDTLRAALVGAFAAVGSDISLGRRLYALTRHAGLVDVQYRPFLIGVRSGDPMTDYLPSTVESLRGTIIERGLMTSDPLNAALADCRAHLRNPGRLASRCIWAVRRRVMAGRGRPPAGEAAQWIPSRADSPSSADGGEA